jgi:transposase
MTRKPYSIQLIELRYRRDFAALCADLRAKGMSWREIGQKFGVSHTLVYKHARQTEACEETATVA